MKTIAKSAVKAIAVVFAVLALFAGFLFANSRGRSEEHTSELQSLA